MAKRTQTLLRTGWLYRISKTGTISAGDMISLIKRPNPEWTVARIMYYLFIETDNMEMMEEIVQIPQLGWDIKSQYQARLDKGVAEDQSGRLFGGKDEKKFTWNEYRPTSKKEETSSVTAFTFEAIDEVFRAMHVEPGSHVRLKLGGKLVRAYSVVGGTSKCFKLGVALEPNSRGGSRDLHKQTKIGDVLNVGRITASFPLAKDADCHIIIAGGIGIAAFLIALEHLHKTKQKVHLHYAVADEIAFAAQIAALGSDVTLYRKSLGQRLDISDILGKADDRTHIYACGSTRRAHFEIIE